MRSSWKWLLIPLITGSFLAVVLAVLSRPAGFSVGIGLLSILSAVLLVAGWHWGGGTRPLAWMMAAAFLLRLIVGVGLSHGLPAYGYDEPETNAGYIYLDAYERDRQAWQIAQSDTPVWQVFRQDFATDQYGGLLALSAFIYRVFPSPVHQPVLIMLLAAFAGTIGLPFLMRAAAANFTQRAAWIAGWLFALYPESILLGASPMREPFIISLTAIAAWAVIADTKPARLRVMVLVAALVGLALISSRVALPVLFILAGCWWFSSDRWPRRRLERALVWVIGLAALAALLWYGYEWLNTSAHWDAILTERGSGWIQLLIRSTDERFRIPFVTLYGIIQPVLPATLIETALPIAHAVSFFKAVGWYVLFPMLGYALFALLQFRKSVPRRPLLLWVAIIIWVWILVASLRAGGDSWDNPRYRTHIMVWIALLAGWAWDWARAHRSTWLPRFYGVLGIFLFFLTWFYLMRYTAWMPDVPVQILLGAASILSLLFVLLGWWQDRAHPKIPAGPVKR